MKKTIMITLCIFLSLFLGTSSAVEVTLFGPNQYLRTTGSPDVYTDTFSAIAGEAKLTVKNGDWGGSKRITDAISSASVVVNGEEIFGTDDFNQQVYLLEASINVAEENSILVELASNPESYITIQVTQEVDPPTVTISAVPVSIMVGESATLTWTSTNAESATIDQGIGTVPVNGSITVSPVETTPYTITVNGLGGTDTDSVPLTVTSPISLQITSPIDGDTISRPDVMVEGTITNATGNETGITVNGILAMVYGDQFVANLVPLEEGENTITVTATDTYGITVTTTITVNAATTEDYIRIAADTESGISPLETTLRIDGSFSFTESSLTYAGPSQVEFLESTSQEYKVRMTTEGIYYFTAHVIDSQSIAHTDTVAVVVLNQTELDALLRAKREGMRSALTQNDVESAVSYFDSSTQDAYKTVFTANPQLLAQMAQVLNDIQCINMMKNSVEFDIRITKDGKEYSFYLLFIKDDKGIWKIKSF